VVILVLNFSMRDSDQSPALVAKMSPPSPQVVVELRQQRRLYAELMGLTETREADRPQVRSPRPRSARTEILTA
jgi:hypothetical protein